jgi:hypothetical protein
MMVRLVSCSVRECRQAGSNRWIRKEGRTEYNRMNTHTPITSISSPGLAMSIKSPKTSTSLYLFCSRQCESIDWLID